MLHRKNFLLIIVSLICLCLFTKSSSTVPGELNTLKVQHFINIIQQRQQLSSQFKQEVNRNFSNPCFGQIYQFTSSLMKGELWALKMVDSSSKLQPGILIGNILDLGMFDECLSINVNKNGTIIRGRYCIYTLSTSIKELNPVLSICVPSICNATDVTRLLNLIIQNVTDIHEFGINVKSMTCRRIDSLDWSHGTLIALFLTIVYILFLIGCTILDILQTTHLDAKFVDILAKFSIRRSALKILNTRINPGSFPALNGIRVLSIAWIVLGHAYAVRASTIINGLYILQWFKDWNSIHVNLAPFAVDTFFTISGFLMAYHFLKKVGNGGSFNIFQYYLHRYLRLTPAVGMLLVLTIFFVPHIGSGPIRERFETYSNCDECWWSILLYVQNFFNKNIMCLAHLWYLAVDMQLFWFSPIILYPLAKNPRIGLIILLASYIASIITTGVIIAVNEYSFDLLAPNSMEMFEKVYKVPYTRAGPWLVGIFIGYLTASRDIRLTKKIEILGWTGAVACFVICTLGVRYTQRREYKYNVIWETIFGSVARSIWGLGLSWIIFTSIKGRGGPVTKFLSLPIFLPLGKLSYCIYLVHMTVQFLIESTLRANVYFSDIQFVSNSFSDFILSIPLAFFFSLFFESPILILEKMILGGEKKTRTKLQDSVRSYEEKLDDSTTL